MVITEEQAIKFAIDFCNQNSISSWKKRERLAQLILAVFVTGYQCGVDDLALVIKERLIRETT